MPRKLTVRTPGAAVSAPERAPEPLPTVPESFLAEIGALSDEGLIALDTAERSGENRPEYLAAIDAELKPRIAKMAGQGMGVPAEAAEDLKALSTLAKAVMAPPEPSPHRGLPTPADIDPSKITTAVLTTEGWILPTAAVPPPIR